MMKKKESKLNILDTWQSELIQLEFEWEAFNSIDLSVYNVYISNAEPMPCIRLRINQALTNCNCFIEKRNYRNRSMIRVYMSSSTQTEV